MFLTIFLLYLRVIPAISIAEVKPVLYVGKKGQGHDTHGGGYSNV
jgi:molybdopterin-containing oxidoreductase family membrane subunit